MTVPTKKLTASDWMELQKVFIERDKELEQKLHASISNAMEGMMAKLEIALTKNSQATTAEIGNINLKFRDFEHTLANEQAKITKIFTYTDQARDLLPKVEQVLQDIRARDERCTRHQSLSADMESRIRALEEKNRSSQEVKRFAGRAAYAIWLVIGALGAAAGSLLTITLKVMGH